MEKFADIKGAVELFRKAGADNSQYILVPIHDVEELLEAWEQMQELQNGLKRVLGCMADKCAEMASRQKNGFVRVKPSKGWEVLDMDDGKDGMHVYVEERDCAEKQDHRGGCGTGGAQPAAEGSGNGEMDHGENEAEA